MSKAQEALEEYYIMSHGLYFRPDCRGYTGIRDQAGLYTKEKAESYPEAKAIHKNEAPEFTSACYEDSKVKHLKKKISDLESRALEPQAVDVEGLQIDNMVEFGEDCLAFQKEACEGLKRVHPCRLSTYLTIQYMTEQGHLRTEPQWQDIITAPKDGTVIIGNANDVICWMDEYDETGAGWCYPQFTYGGTLYEGNNLIDEGDYPTHWMPLPTPPQGGNDE